MCRCLCVSESACVFVCERVLMRVYVRAYVYTHIYKHFGKGNCFTFYRVITLHYHRENFLRNSKIFYHCTGVYVI